ncbi:MAG: helix-turn-helix domain-containing protein [bacterium]|nr:helix-turn-helix domain-containing protein [bacterium]
MDHRTSKTHLGTGARDPQALLNQAQTASLIGVSERTLECWRWKGNGPAFVKISSRAVRYRRQDIEQWVSERIQHSTSEELPR